MLREEREFLSEGPTNQTGSAIDNFDPVLISLIRRAMPNLVAYDLAGVQPMNGPTGLIFAMRSATPTRLVIKLFNELDSAFSGQSSNSTNTAGMTDVSVGLGTTAQGTASDPGVLNDGGATADEDYAVGQGMTTSEAEDLGDGTQGELTKWHSRSRKSPLPPSPVL